MRHPFGKAAPRRTTRNAPAARHVRQRSTAWRCSAIQQRSTAPGNVLLPRRHATVGSGAPSAGAAPFGNAASRLATHYRPARATVGSGAPPSGGAPIRYYGIAFDNAPPSGNAPRSAAERRPVVRHPLGKAPPRLATRPPSATRHAWQRIAVWRCGIYSATRHRDWRRSTAPATRHGRQRACGPATRHARRRGATRQRTPAERIARRVRIADLPRRQLSRPAIRLGLPAPEPMGSSPCFT